MTQLDLPDVHEATLDPATLERLFEDLRACAEILEVSAKGHPERYADAASLDLTTAHALLRSRQVRGVQIRYVHDRKPWCDTLLATPHGVKLVRMRMDHLTPTPQGAPT